MNYLRHQLDAFGEDNSTPTRTKCFAICKEILLLEKEINKLWQKRDYYLKHNCLPEQPVPQLQIPTDPIELARRIESLKKYIRRYKQKLAKQPGNAKYAMLLKQYQEEFSYVTQTKD
jgi:hypothetical protein